MFEAHQMAEIEESQLNTVTISDDDETDIATDILYISSDDDEDVQIVNNSIRVKEEAVDEDCQITQVIPVKMEPTEPRVICKIEPRDLHSGWITISPATNSSDIRFVGNSQVRHDLKPAIKLEPTESTDNKTVTSDCLALLEQSPNIELVKSEYASDDDNATYVSAETYAREKCNFDTLVENVLCAEEQLKILECQQDINQVDKDALDTARSRVNALNNRLELMSQYINDLRIEGETKNVEPKNNEPSISWDRVYAGVNRHRHEAKGSAAEFYQHKSNIISGLRTLYESVGPPPSENETEEQPKSLLVELLKHQKKGLTWMLWRETQKIRGGILADDMGLGKTLSMIALVLASIDQKKLLNPVVKKESDYDYQKKQLELYTPQSSRKPLFAEGKPKVEVKLSPLKREATADDLDNDIEDFLLTKRVCKREAPPQLPYVEDMDDDMDEFLLPQQSKSAGTLVICPTSVMAQWAAEVSSKVASNALKVYIFHGPDRRSIGLSKFRRMNIIITSYGIVSSEYTNYGNNSWLFSSHWERSILDEAHYIRNTKTTAWKSISELKSECCWALTGTPIQNCALDCFALLKFLKVPNFRDLQKWRKYLNEGLAGHRRMNFLIKPLMMRRTKLQLQESGEIPRLPPLEIKFIDVHLSDSEMDVYKILSAISLRIFAQYLRQREQNNSDLDYYSNEITPSFIAGSIEEKYQEIYENFLRSLRYNPKERVKGIVILVLLLRLRQFCCHPGLMVKMLCGESYNEEEEDEEEKVKQEAGELLDIDIPDKSGKPFKLEETHKSSVDVETALKILQPSNPIFEFARPSAKLQLIFATLENILNDTSDKIILVSEWTSYLRVIKDQLELLGHESLDFNGTMDAKARSETLSEFNNIKNNKRILLLSLKAGGVGLNLNVANHLLLVDLHWNPQLERQAQDRIYRYGQLKPSFIYRFMCKDTIEQRIKALQDYKIEIANVVLDHNGAAPAAGANGNALTLNDYKQLFGMK